jgi:hypothetical protein
MMSIKSKGHECPDVWLSDMFHLNKLIVKGNGTQRSDAAIIAHVINVAPWEYNIALSSITQNDINAPYALNRA